jgi:hypothetical protein
MKKSIPEAATPSAVMPKAEAIAKIAKQVAEIRVQLEASREQLKAAVYPNRYALNFQVNALRGKANFWKAQISRLQKEPKTSVDWSKEFQA